MAILSNNFYEANDLTAVYNPIVYQFSATTTGAGAKAQGTILIQQSIGPVTENETITIDSIVLTAKDSPGFNQFYTSTSTSDADIAESIAFAINENPQLNYKYVASSSSNIVTIDAVKNGTKYNKTITTTSPGIFITSSLAGGADATLADSLSNFGVYMDIYVGKSGFFKGSTVGTDEKIIRLIRKYNEDNLYTFDLQGALKNYVDFSTPVLSSKFFKADCTNIYRIKYGVEYSTGENPYIRKYEEGEIDNKWCINSSFNLEENFEMNPYYQLPVSLLTKQPTTKRTYRDQEEWITVFYNRQGYAGFVGLETIFTFKDGSTTTSITSVGKNTKDGVYAYPSGPDFLGVTSLQLSTNKTVDTYLCRVAQVYYSGSSWVVSNYYSDAQVYDLYSEDKCQKYAEKFIWLNPRGAFDSIHFQGVTNNNIKITRENYKVSYNNNFNTSFGLNKTYKIESNDTFKTYSGWINENEMNWLKDMLLSPQVYVIKNSKLYSIQILNQDWSYDSKSNLYALTINWEYSWTNNVITK